MSNPTTQIILDTVYLPITSRDKYSCYEKNLSQQVEMISGRVVEELRGKVYVAEYSYDYMGNDMMRKVLAVLRKGGPFNAFVLPDHSDQLVAGRFICTALSNPTIAFFRGGVPYWHNISFTIREEAPHDQSQ